MSIMHKLDQKERKVAEKAVQALQHAQQKALSTHDVLVVQNDLLVAISNNGDERIMKSVEAAVSVVRGTRIVRKAS